MPAHRRLHANTYDQAHRKRRAALIPAAIGTPCPLRTSPRCVGMMTNPRRMDLDHTVPVILGGTIGDRIVCAPCNRAAGATLGNRLRRTPAHRPASRRWY